MQWAGRSNVLWGVVKSVPEVGPPTAQGCCRAAGLHSTSNQRAHGMMSTRCSLGGAFCTARQCLIWWHYPHTHCCSPATPPADPTDRPTAGARPHHCWRAFPGLGALGSHSLPLVCRHPGGAVPGVAHLAEVRCRQGSAQGVGWLGRVPSGRCQAVGAGHRVGRRPSSQACRLADGLNDSLPMPVRPHHCPWLPPVACFLLSYHHHHHYVNSTSSSCEPRQCSWRHSQHLH